MENVGIFMGICNIIRLFDIICGHMVILWSFWYIYPPVLVYCSKKNLATLVNTVLRLSSEAMRYYEGLCQGLHCR
jgi:hypothetical protein